MTDGEKLHGPPHNFFDIDNYNHTTFVKNDDQILSTNLITSPEMSSLRNKLRTCEDVTNLRELRVEVNDLVQRDIFDSKVRITCFRQVMWLQIFRTRNICFCISVYWYNMTYHSQRYLKHWNCRLNSLNIWISYLCHEQLYKTKGRIVTL
ncbi:ANM_HP_G0211610.mRNA.1.CDS.1 [Saccharomyces cerevisiae]|nr:ANM_HP_G0211610.mRNA.1.CDS.1 [Saccharomyces cerevisiae]CAI6971446.1 ANM_HP_G0211610.mRNA.1.CDS.1 [Saccharomyces cerevisiae]